MSVVNGQLANQTTFNNAFMSRLAANTQTVAKVALENTDVVSGAFVANVQRAINKAFEGVGATGETDTTINDYANENYITNGDNRKVAVGKLDAQLKLTQDDLDVAEGEIATHETRLDAHDVTLADHESRITTNESNIATHETRLDNHDTELADHESRITQNETDIADHESRITDLESNDMSIGGNKTFTGNVVVAGDFEVQGTTTSINSANLEVEDQNILVNKNGSDGSAENAGVDVERPSGNAGMRFDSSLPSKWKIGLLSALREVIVDGVAQTMGGLKDFVDGLKSDTINESTLNAGVTVDGVLIKDGLVDGRDVSVDGSNLDSHIGNTSNPHAVTAAQVGADPAGTAAAAVSAHEAALDPHSQYLTAAEGNAAYDALGAASTVQSNLDTHTGNTSNPHAVTKAQVGLGNVTDDAQLKRAAGDLNSFTEKTVPVANDILILEDSADSFNKKKLKISNLPVSGGSGGKKTFTMKLNGLYGGSAAINAVDGFWVAPANLNITNVYMYNDTSGSSGTTELDLKVKPFASGSFTSVFLTTPKTTSTAGSNTWAGVGDSVTGFTAPVLTSLPFAVAAKSAVRMDLITAQAGNAAGVGLVVEYELL